MYELGPVYIWQNQVGHMAYLNGQETTVRTRPIRCRTTCGRWIVAQVTSSHAPDPRFFVVAVRGDLRPKNPPSGERKILDLFSKNRLREFNN